MHCFDILSYHTFDPSYNNERSGILIFCFESLSPICQIKKSSKRLVDDHLGGLHLTPARENMLLFLIWQRLDSVLC